MTKFAFGSAMGFMLGAGLMMSPSGRMLRRDVRHKMSMVKRWLRAM